MVKSTGDGLKRGHIGGMVFRVVNGKQVIQEMPSNYRDRKSEIYCRPGIDYEMNISDPNLIAVACIHKRLTGSKWKCSTQRLILL